MTDSRLAPRPPGTWRVGRVGDTAVLVRPSLLVVAVALVVVIAPRADRRLMGDDDTSSYVLATAFVVGLYVSVLVHELAHLVAARRYGFRVPFVTLHVLGGETSVEGESRSPRQEFTIAVVGPLASLVIGFVALAVTQLTTEGLAHVVLLALGWVNLLVGLVNLVPGLPLDGGRVLRAAVWAVTGRESTGVRVTGWVGMVLAVAVVAWVLVLDTANGWLRVFDAVIAVAVAFFLGTGATRALATADRSRRVEALRVDRLARPDRGVDPALPQLHVDLSGTSLLRAMASVPAPSYAVVDDSGTLIGVLDASAVDDAYRRTR